MKRYLSALLFAALLTSGCGHDAPPPPAPVPPPVSVPPPKPPPVVVPPGKRALSWFHFGLGIADAAAHPVDYPSMGVVPILVCGNDLFASPSAQSGLDELCSRVRAAVQSGPVALSVRSYSTNGADDNLWTTDAARWAALVQRARWLSTACAAHDIAGVWIDFEFDPDGHSTYHGRPAMPYPGVNAKDAWYKQAWEQPAGVDMAARGREFAQALLSAKPDLTLALYGPYGGFSPTSSKPGHPTPPGFLPFARAFLGAATSRGFIAEDRMIPSTIGSTVAGYVAHDFPGVPVYLGVNFSWQAAAGIAPVGGATGAKYLGNVVAPACRAPSAGAALYSAYGSWSAGLSDPATRAAIKRNLTALEGN